MSSGNYPEPDDVPNPFADPAVTEASLGAPISEYNPFEDVPVSEPAAREPGSGSGFSYDTGVNRNGTLTRNDPVPSSHMDISEESLRARELEISRREAELEYRERKVKEREIAVREMAKPINWPPCRPLIYHDIKEEIPENLQSTVKKVYWSWMLETVCYCFNWIALLVATFSGKEAAPSVGSLLFATILTIFAVPLSFRMWYLVLYRAAKNAKSFKFLMFFGVYGLHIIVAGAMGVGVAETGGAGFVLMIDMFKTPNPSVISGSLAAVSLGLWVINILWSFYCIKVVNAYYRGWDQGNMQAAKREVARDLAVEGAKAAV